MMHGQKNIKFRIHVLMFRLLSIPCLPEPISVTNVISELLSNVHKNNTIPCQHSKLWMNGTLFNDPKSGIVVVYLRLVSQCIYTRLISNIYHCLSQEIVLEFVLMY